MYGSGSKNLYTRDLRSAGQRRADSELYELRPSVALDGEQSKGGNPLSTDERVQDYNFFGDFSLKDYFFHQGDVRVQHARNSDNDDFSSPRESPDAWRTDTGGRHDSIPLVPGGGAGGLEVDPAVAQASPWLLLLWLSVMAVAYHVTASLSTFYSFPFAPPVSAAHRRGHEPEARLKAMMLLILLSTIVFVFGGVGIRLRACLHYIFMPSNSQYDSDWGGGDRNRSVNGRQLSLLLYLPVVLGTGLLLSSTLEAGILGAGAAAADVGEGSVGAGKGSSRRLASQGALLPPAYLSVQGFKRCLGTNQDTSSESWCLPRAQPTVRHAGHAACGKNTWLQLQQLAGAIAPCRQDTRQHSASSSASSSAGASTGTTSTTSSSADLAIGAGVVKGFRWLSFLGALCAFGHHITMAAARGGGYMASYCGSALLFPLAVLFMGVYLSSWDEALASQTPHMHTRTRRCLLLTDPLGLPRLWVWAAYLACYCHFPTTTSALVQACLCGILAHGLGLYGVAPFFAA